jgi:hypothetical protein
LLESPSSGFGKALPDGGGIDGTRFRCVSANAAVKWQGKRSGLKNLPFSGQPCQKTGAHDMALMDGQLLG